MRVRRLGLVIAFCALVVGAVLLLWHGEFKRERRAASRQTPPASGGSEPNREPPVVPAGDPGIEAPTEVVEGPEDEVRWLTELPAAYRGPEFIRGVVVTEKAQPVPGALVMCRPFTWTPFAEPQFRKMVCRTDSRGAFGFREFPTADRYEISVMSALGYSSERLNRVEASDVPLRIVVMPVHYERIGFFGEDGKPIDVSMLYLRLGRGGFVFGSDGAPPPIWLVRWFKATGRPLAWEPHEAVYLFHESHPFARMMNREAPSTPRTIHPPGYRAIDVLELRRPISEWPKVTGRATLRRADLPDGKRRYRCVFPKIEEPAWWGTTEARASIYLGVGFGSRPEDRLWYAPTRQRDQFIGPAKGPLVVRLASSILLPFEQYEEGDVLVLKPKIGPAGFLSLRFPSSRGDRPGVSTHVSLRRGGRGDLIEGQFMWPGLVRYGPLPVGEYTVSLRWSDTSESLGQPTSIRIREGWQEYDAR